MPRLWRWVREPDDLKAGLIGEAVADDAPEGLDAVFPGDFFALFVGATGVGDGNFIDAPIALGDLGGDFGLEAEAVGFDRDALEDFTTEDLVAGLHIGEFEVGED